MSDATRVEQIRKQVERADAIGSPTSRFRGLEQIGTDAAVDGWIGSCRALLSEIDRLRRERDRLKEALERIDGFAEETIFSTSRAEMDGNEAYMEGANSAFCQAADVATDALQQGGRGGHG